MKLWAVWTIYRGSDGLPERGLRGAFTTKEKAVDALDKLVQHYSNEFSDRYTARWKGNGHNRCQFWVDGDDYNYAFELRIESLVADELL